MKTYNILTIIFSIQLTIQTYAQTPKDFKVRPTGTTATTEEPSSAEEISKFLEKLIGDSSVSPELQKKALQIKNKITAGVVIGDGSHVILKDGKYLLADLFLNDTGELPPHYKDRLQLSDFIRLPEANQKIEAFIKGKLSFDNKKKFFEEDWPISKYEIYRDDKLNCNDPATAYLPTSGRKFACIITEDGEKIPVAVTFTVDTRRIIGLNVPVFKKLTPRVQALILTHERLHHQKNFAHDIIYPLIKNLKILADLADKQNATDPKDLVAISKDELEAAKTFQVTLFKYHKGAHVTISEQGGGLVWGLPGKGVSTTKENFTSVSSSINILYFMDFLKQNTFLDSNFSINSLDIFSGKKFKKTSTIACYNNVFYKVKSIALLCAGNNNTFKNIESFDKSTRNTITRGIMPRDFDDDLSATFNKIYDFEIYNSVISNHKIILTGDNNFLNNITFKGLSNESGFTTHSTAILLTDKNRISSCNFTGGKYFFDENITFEKCNILNLTLGQNKNSYILNNHYPHQMVVRGLNLEIGWSFMLTLKSTPLEFEPGKTYNFVNIQESSQEPHRPGDRPSLHNGYISPRRELNIIWDFRMESVYQFERNNIEDYSYDPIFPRFPIVGWRLRE